MTSTAVDVYGRAPLRERQTYALTLAGAADLIPRGLFDKATGKPSPAKILLVMETGAMLGLHPMAALQGIDVIEGKATISPALATALIRGAGHKLRIVDEGTVEGGDFRVTVTLIRADDPDEPITASWSMQQAARAGLCEYTLNPETGVWKVDAWSKPNPKYPSDPKPLPWMLYPEDMCQWRALSRLGRKGAMDVLMGVRYFPEELEAVVNEDGIRDDSALDEQQEAEFLARIAEIDDREDMRTLYRLIRDDEAWTPKLTAAFDAHLMTLTKDSNPPEKPSPGNTGDPDFDGSKETGAAEAEQGQETAPAASASTSPESTPNPAEGHTAAETARVETEEERFERESREAFDREMAAKVEDAVIVSEDGTVES